MRTEDGVTTLSRPLRALEVLKLAKNASRLGVMRYPLSRGTGETIDKCSSMAFSFQ